jgi:hypothetical protein
MDARPVNAREVLSFTLSLVGSAVVRLRGRLWFIWW